MSNDHLFSADARKSAGARQLGEMLLRGIRGVGSGPGSMSKGMMAGHVSAAAGGNFRDFGRVASTRDDGGRFSKARDLLEETATVDRCPPGPFRDVLERSLAKRADELADHMDRPTREHALSATQHRELAREHEVREYVERSAGNIDGARAHEAAANAHHRAAHLASERHSDAAWASFKAREATRHANRKCHHQVTLETHKAAAGDGFSAPAGRVRGSDTPFGSNAVREEHFREPHADPNAFHESGRVRGAGSTARQGYEYPADAAASPMQRLFGPAANARDMNWDGDDDFGHEHRYTRPARGDLNWHRDDGLTGNMRQRHMTEGRVPQYRPDRPYPGYAGDEHGRTFEELIDGKAAGIAPGESLTAFAKRLMGGSAGTSFAKSLDVAFEHRHELGEGLYRDYVAMRSNIADARRPDDWRRSDLYRDLLGRIERCAASRLIKRELVQALA